MVASELINEVSDRLNDQEASFEFTLMSDVSLLASLNWALSILADLKPLVFAKPTSLPMPTGSLLDVSAYCERFLPPYSLLDKQGRFIRNLYPEKGEPSPLALKQRCSGSDKGPLYISPVTDTVLEVRPEVQDEGWRLQGLCVSTPQATHNNAVLDVPERFKAVLIELMMHYSHMYETESVTSRERAQIHWTIAMTLINPRGAK